MKNKTETLLSIPSRGSLYIETKPSKSENISEKPQGTHSFVGVFFIDRNGKC